MRRRPDAAACDGDVVCATAANLFVLRDGRWLHAAGRSLRRRRRLPGVGCCRAAARGEARLSRRRRSKPRTRFSCAMRCAVSSRSRGWAIARGRRIRRCARCAQRLAARASGIRRIRGQRVSRRRQRERRTGASAVSGMFVRVHCCCWPAPLGGTGCGSVTPASPTRRWPGCEAGETLLVERGDSLPRVLRQAARGRRRARASKLEWQALARQLGAAGKLQVGEYALDPGTTPRELLIAHARRQGHQPSLHHRRRLEHPRTARRAGQGARRCEHETARARRCRADEGARPSPASIRKAASCRKPTSTPAATATWTCSSARMRRWTKALDAAWDDARSGPAAEDRRTRCWSWPRSSRRKPASPRSARRSPACSCAA